jgi:hypothetical protein
VALGETPETDVIEHIATNRCWSTFSGPCSLDVGGAEANKDGQMAVVAGVHIADRQLGRPPTLASTSSTSGNSLPPGLPASRGAGSPFC